MAYKITFKTVAKKRTPQYQWTDNEKQIETWKKTPIILDEIIIKPSGRKIRSKPFKRNVIFTIYDYGIFLVEKKVPLEIVVECDPSSGKPIDVIIPYKSQKAARRTDIKELLDAIVLADKQYRGTGGVLYTKQLHENPDLMKKLAILLTDLKYH